MVGISEKTGRMLTRSEHIQQSISIILRTRIGTRVLRRGFGSDVPNLVDAPAINDEVRLDLIVAVESAIRASEPRVILQSVAPRVVANGKIELALVAIDRETGEQMALVEALR